MKTLFLHIGTAKTGTSAIQKFCAHNRKTLIEKGYSYPVFPAQYAYTPKNHNGYFLRIEKIDDNNESMFWKCMDVLRDAFENCPNAIISDEGMWRAGQKRHKLISETMKKEGYQVKVIVYLRRQDEYLISKWKQFVKWGYFASTQREKDAVADKFQQDGGLWETFLQYSKTDTMMDYSLTLKKLEKVYGKENIIVKRYDRNSFPDGSICADFLQTIGLELTEEYNDSDIQANGGLTPNTAEIQRILNTIPGNEEYDNHVFIQNILLSFSDISAQKYQCSMFSEEENIEFMERYREGNNRVARDYLGEEELFHEREHAPIQKWEKNNPCMQDDMIRFVGTTCFFLLEENRKLQNEITQLKDKIRHPFRTIINKFKKE